jgi:hypothetical protein
VDVEMAECVCVIVCACVCVCAFACVCLCVSTAVGEVVECDARACMCVYAEEGGVLLMCVGVCVLCALNA